MKPFRVLITGSRTWDDHDAIVLAFDKVPPLAGDREIVLIHGAAAGADILCAQEASRRGWTIEDHRAKWGTHTDACPDWHNGMPKCRMAGHRRNAEMVDSGADVCFAFIRDNSAGASGCLRLAEKAGIDSYVWRAA